MSKKIKNICLAGYLAGALLMVYPIVKTSYNGEIYNKIPVVQEYITQERNLEELKGLKEKLSVHNIKSEDLDKRVDVLSNYLGKIENNDVRNYQDFIKKSGKNIRDGILYCLGTWTLTGVVGGLVSYRDRRHSCSGECKCSH